MDGQRFDAVIKAMAAGTSRRVLLRRALGGVGAGLLALVGVADAGAAGKRNCAKACKQRFGPGRARGQCVSACARGVGEVIDEGPVPCGEIPGMECSEGFTCVEGFCRQTCGAKVCGPEEFCCSPSCGICAPNGGFCTQQFCE